ncbi:hypothetical protein AVEN_113854-1 [Araneus ventricosus]|uniref:Reverse transcriptase domain-containing protein n=1 Tax=Araneus ventricosus TaxID=182803 RepID=A0A4Y2N0C3_ARAVE|nr:hypothetical protein AVEN_113854-1 [Araneus ventricosus]
MSTTRLADPFSLTSAFQPKHFFSLASRRRTQNSRNLCTAIRFDDKDTTNTRKKIDKLAEESTNSLNDRQHGFREGKSVDTAINELLRKIKTARRDGKHVLVLSIDIKGELTTCNIEP